MSGQLTGPVVVLVFLLALALTSAVLTRARRQVTQVTQVTQVAVGPRPAATSEGHAAATAERNDPLITARATLRDQGGAVFLGLAADTGDWVSAPREQAVLVLGPPRSGKTTSVIVPSILLAPGPVVSTSTKTDVLHATAAARARLGRVWLFDPTGSEETPEDVEELRWSPLQSSITWNGARLMADAMVGASTLGKGSEDAKFWASKAKELLAPLLYAAATTGRGIEHVYAWVAGADLDEATLLLLDAADQGDDSAGLAACSLIGIDRHGERLRGDVFATAQPVLWPYGSLEVLQRSSYPNFDPDAFVASHDTVYISAPAHQQHLCAPLVVGLLEDIRTATFRRARRPAPPGHRRAPVLWALDEAANVARFEQFPNLVSEGGGQGLQVVACFQDLSQARARWDTAADGFLTLFGVKVVFGRIGDKPTLDALSALGGEWEEEQINIALVDQENENRPTNPLKLGEGSRGWTRGQNVTTSWQRKPILPPRTHRQPPARRGARLHPRRLADRPQQPALRSRTHLRPPTRGRGTRTSDHHRAPLPEDLPAARRPATRRPAAPCHAGRGHRPRAPADRAANLHRPSRSA